MYFKKLICLRKINPTMARTTCIVCKEPVKKSDGYIHYNICHMKSNKISHIIGKMDVHRTQDCFIRGATILLNQFKNCVNPSHIEVTVFLTGEKYVYNMEFISNYFNLIINWGNDIDKDMYNIFKKCRKKELVFGSLNYFHNSLEPSVPILLSTTNDPIFPQEILNDIDYLQRVKNAEEKLMQNTQVRGHIETEYMYMLYSYVMETKIMI